ncbi:MAG TPA: lipocalin-like domain-containing protein [Candidatus Binatia bacterium]|nr:lipocalin-like domain-containing protein [Candidatus Binatia bacterium]
MKRLTSGVLTVIVLLLPLLSSGQGANQNAQDRFLGGWRLAWLEEPDAEGNIHKADCTGLLVYSRDGHMSVQVMYRTPPSQTRSAPVQYAQGGYEASFGRYQINDAHSFTFHVEGALVRTLVGEDLQRMYDFSGNLLIVKSPDPNEKWRVAWEHY